MITFPYKSICNLKLHLLEKEPLEEDPFEEEPFKDE